MDSETLTKLRAAAQDLPRGVAARIDAPDLVQLLDEREALFAVVERFWKLACTEGDFDSDTDWEAVRLAYLKAGGVP